MPIWSDWREKQLLDNNRIFGFQRGATLASGSRTRPSGTVVVSPIPSRNDSGRRFDDVFNLVCDPAFLTVARAQVRGNRGARSAGVDGVAPRSILFGAETFLVLLRDRAKRCPALGTTP